MPLKPSHLSTLKENLKDNRSKTVIFVSHCLLNENARYLGGAFHPGGVIEITNQLQSKGYGIVQLPCPEHAAWGGIDKPYLWLGVGLAQSTLYQFRKIIFPIFLWRTRRVYKRFAKKTCNMIRDYLRAGYRVAGIIGVDGSPTCGVKQTLTLEKYEIFAQMDPTKITREAFNSVLYQELLIPGPGLFIKELISELTKCKLDIPFVAHDLVKEMSNIEQKISL